MRHMKRMTVLLITAAFLILMPANALAAAREYVPTEATYYELKGGKWEEISKQTFSYTKNGRIKSHTSEIIQSGFSVRTAYTSALLCACCASATFAPILVPARKSCFERTYSFFLSQRY